MQEGTLSVHAEASRGNRGSIAPTGTLWPVLPCIVAVVGEVEEDMHHNLVRVVRFRVSARVRVRARARIRARVRGASQRRRRERGHTPAPSTAWVGVRGGARARARARVGEERVRHTSRGATVHVAFGESTLCAALGQAALRLRHVRRGCGTL